MPRPIRLLAVLLPLLLVATPARAQSDRELRTENQRLQGRVRDLEQELAAARERIAELEAQVESLREALRNRGGGRPAELPPLPAEEISIDESVPTASPRALRQALEASFEEAMKELEPGAPGSAERRAYVRALRSWMAGVSRTMKGPIEWHVRLIEGAASTHTYAVQLQAVDPGTGVELGDPFWTQLSRLQARRLEQYFALTGEREALVLRGTLVPEPVLNPDRAEAGMFDTPPLIGPFVEFGYRVDTRTLLPVSEDEDEDEGG